MRYLRKIDFNDKKINSSIDDNDENFITGGNVNTIKSTINNVIERSNLQDILIDNLQEVVSNMANLKIFQDNYPSKDELESFITLTQNDLGKLETLISKGVKGELETFIDQTKNNFKDIYKKIDSIDSKNSDFNDLINGLPKTFSNIDTQFTIVNNLILDLKEEDKSFKINLIDIKRDIRSQNSSILKNYNEFQVLKNVVNDNQKKIKELQTSSSILNSNDLNKLFLDNTNILYYLDQCQERLFLQDSRQDHLERMIRGIDDHYQWDDWNRLFNLLNLLKLKISRLSLVRHAQMKDVIFNDEELRSFKHLLNEVELKLKNFNDEEIEEIDIDRAEIQQIIDNIDTNKSIDPGVFEFYPNYPENNE